MESSRLVANPCLSVQDLENCITTWVTTSMNTDVYVLLKPPAGLVMNWKSAPQIEWLSKVSPLFALLAQICPNTVLTSKKVIQAFKSLREGKKITSSSEKKGEDFDDWCDQVVRILFAQFREVKRNATIRSRCQKKSGTEQWQNILCVLDKITVPENAEATTIPTSRAAPAVPAIPSSWGSLAACTTNTVATDSFSIFKKIISAAPTEEPASTTGQADATSSLPLASLAKATSTPAPLSPAPARQVSSNLDDNQKLHSPVCLKKWKMFDTPSPSPSGDLSAAEKAMLQSCLAAKPTPKAASKRAAKQVDKGKKNTDSDVSSRKIKRAEKANLLEEGHAKKEPKRKKGNQEGQEEDWPPASEKVKRHRFVSQAYHKEYVSMYKASNDKVQAKEAGRIAYQKAAQEWKAKHSQR